MFWVLLLQVIFGKSSFLGRRGNLGSSRVRLIATLRWELCKHFIINSNGSLENYDIDNS